MEEETRKGRGEEKERRRRKGRKRMAEDKKQTGQIFDILWLK